MNDASHSAPPSPCIQVCELDDQGLCRGCYRTRAEIATWIRLSAEDQHRVIARCRERRGSR